MEPVEEFTFADTGLFVVPFDPGFGIPVPDGDVGVVDFDFAERVTAATFEFRLVTSEETIWEPLEEFKFKWRFSVFRPSPERCRWLLGEPLPDSRSSLRRLAFSDSFASLEDLDSLDLKEIRNSDNPIRQSRSRSYLMPLKLGDLVEECSG